MPPMVGLSTNATEPLTGAAMNAILHYPTNLATDIQQMRSEVESHRQEIVAEAVAFEQTQAAWASQELDLTRRMDALRQRLASLLA